MSSVAGANVTRRKHDEIVVQCIMVLAIPHLWYCQRIVMRFIVFLLELESI